MKHGPAAATDLLETVVQIDSPPRPSQEILAEIIAGAGWAASLAVAAELAEKWDEGFRRRLKTRMSEMHAAGRVCSYDFNSSSGYMLQGAAFVEPGVDSPELAASKRRRQRYRRHLIFLRAVVPGEFEVLCRGILDLLGVRNTTLTSDTADQGIDFYGQLELGELLSPASLPGLHSLLKIWMVGQAKHYPTGQAATPEIRELVGAVALAQAGAYSRVSEPYPDLDIKLCDPVFFLFFTTGTISSAGWRLLDSSGVIGMDGEMIAAFLAENEVGVRKTEFAEEAMVEWMASHSD